MNKKILVVVGLTVIIVVISMISSWAFGVSFFQGTLGLAVLAVLFFLALLGIGLYLIMEAAGVERPDWLKFPMGIFYLAILGGALYGYGLVIQWWIVWRGWSLLEALAAAGLTTALVAAGVSLIKGLTAQRISTIVKGIVVLSVASLAVVKIDTLIRGDRYYDPTTGASIVKYCPKDLREYRDEKFSWNFCPYDNDSLIVITSAELKKLREEREGKGAGIPTLDGDGESIVRSVLSKGGEFIDPHSGWWWFYLITSLIILYFLFTKNSSGDIRSGWAAGFIGFLLLGTALLYLSEGEVVSSFVLEEPSPPHWREEIRGGVKITFDSKTPSLIPTGFMVEVGQKVKFIAEADRQGKYRWDPEVSESWVSPNGASYTPFEVKGSWFFPVPDAPIASVIGFIGDKGFFIGKMKEVTFRRAGEIRIGLNERQGEKCYQDNLGKISVFIVDSS